MVQLERDSTTPLYIQLSQILLENILDGAWSLPNSQLPTEPDLCETYDVARGTVRQALALLEEQGYVRRERGRGTFVNDQQGMLPNPTPTRYISLIVPYIRDGFVTTILTGAERAASQHGYTLSFTHVENDPRRQAETLRAQQRTDVAGCLLYPVDSQYDTNILEISRGSLPLVMIDRYIHGIASHYVIADNFGGALQATQHLIALGHEQIGFVTWEDVAVSLTHRQRGYEQALIEAGLPHNTDYVTTVRAYPVIEHTPLREILQPPQRPTAILAANDPLAYAIYHEATSLGLRVPDDIAIMGFGDHDIGVSAIQPLSTVNVPAYNLGYKAAELLIQILEQETQQIERIVLPTQLIIRESCGGYR